MRRPAAERKAAFTALARSGKVDLIDVSTDGQHFDALVRFFRLRESRRRRGPMTADRQRPAVVLLVGAAPPPAVVRLNTGDPANLIEARAQLDAGDIRLSGEVKLTLTVEGPGPLERHASRSRF